MTLSSYLKPIKSEAERLNYAYICVKIFTNVLPETRFIHATHSSNHTLEQAHVFVADIKSKSDG